MLLIWLSSPTPAPHCGLRFSSCLMKGLNHKVILIGKWWQRGSCQNTNTKPSWRSGIHEIITQRAQLPEQLHVWQAALSPAWLMPLDYKVEIMEVRHSVTMKCFAVSKSKDYSKRTGLTAAVARSAPPNVSESDLAKPSPYPTACLCPNDNRMWERQPKISAVTASSSLDL